MIGGPTWSSTGSEKQAEDPTIGIRIPLDRTLEDLRQVALRVRVFREHDQPPWFHGAMSDEADGGRAYDQDELHALAQLQLLQHEARLDGLCPDTEKVAPGVRHA